MDYNNGYSSDETIGDTDNSPQYVPPTPPRNEKRKRKLPWHLSESKVEPPKKATPLGMSHLL